MKLPLVALLAAAPLAAAADSPKPLVQGLKNPESIAVGPTGKVYATQIGEFDRPGDGSVVVLDSGKATPLVTGLDDPKGIAAFRQWLFVADRNKVLRISEKGKVDVFAPPTAFPAEPKFLNDVTVDPESGTVYVSDSGDFKGSGGVYRITPKGRVSLVADAKTVPGLMAPNGLALDGASHLLIGDAAAGTVTRVRVADGAAEKVADGLGVVDGIAWDYHGRLYVSDWKGGKVYGIARPGEKPVLVADGFKSAADLCFHPATRGLLVPDMLAGTVVVIPAAVPGFEVDESPLPIGTELAFPDLAWTGWSAETETGKLNQHRPIVLTHANDGSNRVFVATQHGVIHVFPNDPKAARTRVFLDITDRVKYDDRTNEEGFLGLAFHPDYKRTGEFFVFYTPKKEKATNLVVRFRVSKDDPDRADPASEEVIYRYANKPFWNHDGGTVCFGPDGMLYFTHGDGGSANDPFDNGQKLSTPFGKVLRVDVNARENGKNYAVPKDNPFVGKPDALPEIWAYGVRNLWRMAFDPKTGRLWAGEVGQNLYEEINIITRGGNYGWNRRESLHPFGPKGTGHGPAFIDPIWEYHHDVGKSITGGGVYRGRQFPQLDGHYLYADYVSNKVWALRYDDEKRRVVANRPIQDPNRPVLSFGEDDRGEFYLLTASTNGKGIFRLAAKP